MTTETTMTTPTTAWIPRRTSRWAIVVALVAAVAAMVSGCRTREIETAARFGTHNATEHVAAAVFAPKSGGEVRGTLELRELVTPHTLRHDTFNEVMAYVRVEGLEPGTYTMRIHDAGTCAAPSAVGPDDQSARHNARTLVPDDDGVATLSAALTRVTLRDDPRSIVGKPFVIHEGTGPEGTPVACGTAAIVESEAKAN